MKTERQRAKITADKWFSRFIRLRDSLGNGVGKCVTCGKIGDIKYWHAGHFVKRDRMSLRYSEENVHLQCIYCNKYRSGKEAEHARYIDQRYGAGTADKLILAGKSNRQVSSIELRAISDHYREKANKLGAKQIWKV